MPEDAVESPDKRLLIVDDEEGPRQSLNMIFCDEFEVIMASSGEQAVRLAKENTFSVVITDIRMRGMSGIDVLRELKAINGFTEVIVLTAYETLDTARQAISYGASDYLKKPFDIEHIQNVVDKCYHHYLFSTKQDALVRKDVNKAKTTFLEIVSHELNTPMNGILGFMELLQDTELDEEQQEFVSSIRDCSLQYFEHVQDILTYAKMAMSEREVSSASFNPSTLLLKLHHESKPENGLSLDFILPEDLPAYVSGPEYETRIILKKLLSNALKFTAEGGVVVRVNYQGISPDSGDLHFEVRDSGKGIDPEMIESGKIFDAFSQADSSLRREHGGLGLGLSLCKTLSDRLKAGLSVESAVGEGTCFRFSIRVAVEVES